MASKATEDRAEHVPSTLRGIHLLEESSSFLVVVNPPEYASEKDFSELAVIIERCLAVGIRHSVDDVPKAA